MSEFTRQEVIEAVRVAMLLHMNDASLTPADVARDTGYDRVAVWRFLRGEITNLVMSQRLAEVYAPVGRLECVCQHCGRLPHFGKK